MTFRPIAALLLAAALACTACQRAPAPAPDAAPDAGSAAAPAPPATPRPPNETEAGQRIEADVAALADEAMAGREAGTAGYERAARHVAGRYAAIGLLPAGDAGDWFQSVPLLRATALAEGARLELRREGRATALELRTHFLPGVDFNREASLVEAPAVFVGQAVHAPELGHDDFAGLDLRGKVAVMFGGAPGTFDDTRRAFHSSRREKLRNVVERGAVGAVFVNTVDDEARHPWSRAVEHMDKPAMRLRDADGRGIDTWPQLQATAVVSAAAADLLFEGGELTAAQLFDAAREGRLRGFDLPGTLLLAARSRIEPVASSNVVGRIAGSDPALASEHVVYTAHLDHLGTGGGPDGDAVYSGALDNALGVAIMLEAARELAAAPAPKRSLLFVALTAEEQGLLGAEWFARNPSVDGALVANINMDMPMLTAPTTDVVPVGVEHSTLDAVLEQAAGEIGVALSPDPFPEEVVFVRSDQYAFVRAGIPAIYLMGGVVGANPGQDPKLAMTWFLRNCYHQPCDNLELPIQYGDAARMARLNARIGQIVGDAVERPAWKAGDFFGGKFGGGGDR